MEETQRKNLKKEINRCKRVQQLQKFLQHCGKFELSEEFLSEKDITKAREMALFLVENYNLEPIKLSTEDEFYTEVYTVFVNC